MRRLWFSIIALVGICVVAILGITWVYGKFKDPRQDAKHPKATVVVKQHYPEVDLHGYQPVHTGTLPYLMNTPFYTTLPYTDFREGDIVKFTASGAGGFDRFLRTLVGDRVSPNGWTKCPEDLGTSQDPEKYLIRGKGVPVAALVGGFGKIEYDEKRIARLEGSQHFLIGELAYVEVPQLEVPKLHLTLNEKWVPAAFEDNIGGFTVNYTVYRKNPTPT